MTSHFIRSSSLYNVCYNPGVSQMISTYIYFPFRLLENNTIVCEELFPLTLYLTNSEAATVKKYSLTKCV